MVISIASILAMVALAGDTAAKTYNVSDGNWKFSFVLNTPITTVLNTEAYKSNDTQGGLTVRNQVILLNESTKKKLATIETYSYQKPVPMSKYEFLHTALEAMMNARNFTNMSYEMYKIDGTKGIIGSGYNKSLGAREYWTYSLIWPSSDSTSERAVGIVSLLGDNLSYQLFDTIHFEQANGWKEPLPLFLNSSEKALQENPQIGTKKPIAPKQ
jgi:hypothetical protein